MANKLTNVDVRQLKGTQKIVSITAYDFYGARMAEEAGVDFILVGDSLGNVIQGHDSSLKVTVDHMVYHTEIVSRGAPDTFIVADMPYLSYHLSEEDTVRNAARLMIEGNAGAVKLEGGCKRVPMIHACLQAEIPVMGHIGLTPQSHHVFGGYKVQRDRQRLLDDAQAVQEAGAFALVLEAMPLDIAQEITQSVDIPTIGIGAGVHCDGQIIVFHDVLGYHNNRQAKFVKTYSDLWTQGVKALESYAQEVRQEHYPDESHSYHAKQKKAGA